jgi:hypothetical protein
MIKYGIFAIVSLRILNSVKFYILEVSHVGILYATFRETGSKITSGIVSKSFIICFRDLGRKTKKWDRRNNF